MVPNGILKSKQIKSKWSYSETVGSKCTIISVMITMNLKLWTRIFISVYCSISIVNFWIHRNVCHNKVPQRYLHCKNMYVSPEQQCILFDSLILHYASEILGFHRAKDIELIHKRFCRYLFYGELMHYMSHAYFK